MKYGKKRVISLLSAMVLLGSVLFAGTAFGEDAETADPASGMLSAAGAASIPENQWQKTAVFPDWKGYTDDTLAMNSMLSFQCWHRQGTLWLSVSGEVESFALYVNGVSCDTSAMTAGAWAVDISGVSTDGVNTIQVSNILPLGLKGAVTVYIPYPVVEEALDSLEGIRPETLQLISDIIETDIGYGFSGAQLAIVKNGRLVYENAWGYINRYEPGGGIREEGTATDTDTLYDLASVTKMFSVNYAIQKLVTDGQLDIDQPVAAILGDGFAEQTLDIVYAGTENPPDYETQKAWKRTMTVRDVLRHQAGFPADLHYFNPDYDISLLADGEPGSNPCYTVTREETLGAIFKTPLAYEPGTKTLYSDVDYMLLTFVVEHITGKRLDEYMKETFYAPLGLDHITYLPLENGFDPEDCAATELNGNTRDNHISFPGIRTGTLQGQVHDEKAWYCMGGVSGHAGLFANASDLAVLASVMLTGGYGGYRFFSRDVLDLFTAPKSLDFGQWGLGWWREGDDKRVWYFGTQSASATVGHQGWTGTLAMIDPSRNLVVVYLTNKINSPVTDPDTSLDRFDGNHFTASTLGFVPQILSVGMDTETDISGQLLDLVADMAAESLKLIPEGADGNHPKVRNAGSRIDVLRKWASAAESGEKLQFADMLASMLPGEAN